MFPHEKAVRPGPFFGDPVPPSTLTQQPRHQWGGESPAFEDLPSPTPRVSFISLAPEGHWPGFHPLIPGPRAGPRDRGSSCRVFSALPNDPTLRCCRRLSAALCTCCRPRGTRRRRPSLEPPWLQHPLYLGGRSRPPGPWRK